MYVPNDKMKINRFKVVAIPRPIEYMRRFGAASTPSNAYTGDDVAPVNKNKVEVLADAAYLNDLQMKNDESANG